MDPVAIRDGAISRIGNPKDQKCPVSKIYREKQILWDPTTRELWAQIIVSAHE